MVQSKFVSVFWTGCVAGCLLLAHAATAGTAEDLAKAQGLLQRAEANLKSVDASIGQRTSPPKGSAAKLAASRLQQAADDLQPAGQLIGNLPADGEGVAEMKQRFQAAAETYARLQKILTGQAGPPPGSETDDGSVPLKYPQDRDFAAYLTALTRLEQGTQQINQIRANFQAVDNPLAISHADAEQAHRMAASARNQMQALSTNLESLPANGTGVAQAKERLVVLSGDVDANAVYFERVLGQITAAMNPPQQQWVADRDMMQQVLKAYGNESAYLDDAERFAELLEQREAAEAQLIKVASKYQVAMREQSEAGKAIEMMGNGVLRNFAEFDGFVTQRRETLPQEARGHLEEAAGYARQAVEEQKPGWFNGGIPQQMEFADQKITILEAIAPEVGQELRTQYEAQQQTLREQAASLEDLIIRTNTPPADNYGGEDRPAVIDMAVSGWKVQQPDAEIVASMIPGESWQRVPKWTFHNGSATFTDYSYLRVMLLVADPDQPDRVIERGVRVRRDNLSDGKLIGIPDDDFEQTPLQPSDYILRDKL